MKLQPLQNLSVSKIVFWNRGSEIIDYENIVPGHPIQIVGRDTTCIITAKLLVTNNAASNLAVKICDGRGLISFGYLGTGHGGVFQVIHDGRSSYDLTVVGAIKGAERIRRIAAEFDDWRPREDRSSLVMLGHPPTGLRERRFVVVLPFILAGMTIAVLKFVTALGLPYPEIWGIISLFGLMIGGISLASKLEARNIPKNLEIVFSDDNWG